MTPCDLGEGEPALLTLGQLTASKWQEPTGIQRDHAGFACSGETSVGVSMITQFRFKRTKLFEAIAAARGSETKDRGRGWTLDTFLGDAEQARFPQAWLVNKQMFFLQRQGDLRNPSHGICPLGLIRRIVNYPILTPI